MKIKLSQNDFKKLMKETIEDVALANAIDKGLKSKPVSPTLRLNTNLVLKAEIEFLESFFDDFENVEDKNERQDVTRLISELSQGKSLAKVIKILTQKHNGYFRIAAGERFVCLKITESKMVFVRLIHKSEITKNFVGTVKPQKVK